MKVHSECIYDQHGRALAQNESIRFTRCYVHLKPVGNPQVCWDHFPDTGGIISLLILSGGLSKAFQYNMMVKTSISMSSGKSQLGRFEGLPTPFIKNLQEIRTWQGEGQVGRVQQLEGRNNNLYYSWTSLFGTRLIQNPCYCKSSWILFVWPSLGVNSVISKPLNFKLFFMSCGTSKERGLTVFWRCSYLQEIKCDKDVVYVNVQSSVTWMCTIRAHNWEKNCCISSLHPSGDDIWVKSSYNSATAREVLVQSRAGVLLSMHWVPACYLWIGELRKPGMSTTDNLHEPKWQLRQSD